MRRRAWAISLLLSGGLTAWAGGVTARVTTASQAPLTPGAVALLANTMDAPALQTVADAIAADDPMVRTVAARIAAATAHPPFAIRVAAAFERESDPTAAMEQARALLIVRGAESVQAIEARLDTFSPLAAAVYAEWIAARQPERLAEILPRLAARASPSRAEFASAIQTALINLGDRPAPGAALLAAWFTAAAPFAWRSTLSGLVDRPQAWLDVALQQLPPAEQRRFEAMRIAAQKRPASLTPGAEPPDEPMRLMPALWPGFLASLLDAARCRPERGGAFGIVGVAYRADGRPSKIAPQRTQLPSSCTAAVNALARLTLRDPEQPVAPDAMEWLILPMGPDHLECANKTPIESAAGNRVGPNAGIQPPRKIRDVRPEYPPRAQKDRITGLVRMEGVIASSGCVSSLRIARGIDTDLNFSAIRAVSGWRFSPTLLNGAPVPVQMTITVSYNLQ